MPNCGMQAKYASFNSLRSIWLQRSEASFLLSPLSSLMYSHLIPARREDVKELILLREARFLLLIR